MRALMFLRHVDQRWRDARLSQINLGKYVVAYASLLHFIWAFLLLLDDRAQGSTPVSIISKVCGGPVRSAVVLAVFGTMAIVFPFLKHRVSNAQLAVLLIPQQMLLILSAGAGLTAVVRSSYADGVVRAASFILADQLPSILLAILYTAVVVEASFHAPTEEEVDDERRNMG